MTDAPEDAPVGVVGEPIAGVRDAVESTGRRAVVGDPDEVLAADPALTVAVGERALSGIAAADASAHDAAVPPVLPVDAGPGVPTVSPADAGPALEAALADECDAAELPVLSASIEGGPAARALFDLTLVTAEPARISEFAVRSGSTAVATVRADGLVVATPAGSHGYAHRVDAPLVAPDTGVLAVAPIAPFTTDPDRWVLPDGDLTLRVERDEAAVELLADDRTVGPVEPGAPITVSRAGSLSVLAPSESRGPFAAGE